MECRDKPEAGALVQCGANSRFVQFARIGNCQQDAALKDTEPLVVKTEEARQHMIYVQVFIRDRAQIAAVLSGYVQTLAQELHQVGVTVRVLQNLLDKRFIDLYGPAGLGLAYKRPGALAMQRPQVGHVEAKEEGACHPASTLVSELCQELGGSNDGAEVPFLHGLAQAGQPSRVGLADFHQHLGLVHQQQKHPILMHDVPA